MGTTRTSVTFDKNSFTSGTPQGTGDIAYIIVNQYWVTGNTGTIDDIDNLKIMLNKGDTALPYEPYGSGEWYKKEYIGKTVLNGTEDIRKNNAGDSNNWVYYYKQTQYDYSALIISQCKSNYLRYVAGGVSNISSKEANGFASNSSYQVTYFNIGSILETNTLEALKTLLTQLYTNNNPLIFYLVLVTPNDIKITDTNLISQLEAIDKMQSYEGTTIITSTYDSANSQMILGASGLKGE